MKDLEIGVTSKKVAIGKTMKMDPMQTHELVRTGSRACDAELERIGCQFEPIKARIISSSPTGPTFSAHPSSSATATTHS